MLNIVIVWYAILSVAAANVEITEYQLEQLKGTNYTQFIDEVIQSTVEMFTDALQLKPYADKLVDNFLNESYEGYTRERCNFLTAMNYANKREIGVIPDQQCIYSFVGRFQANAAKIRNCVTEFAESVNPDTDFIRHLTETTTNELQGFKEEVNSCSKRNSTMADESWQCIKEVLRQVCQSYVSVSAHWSFISPLQLESAQERYETGDVICTNGFDIERPNSIINLIIEEYKQCNERATNESGHINGRPGESSQ